MSCAATTFEMVRKEFRRPQILRPALLIQPCVTDLWNDWHTLVDLSTWNHEVSRLGRLAAASATVPSLLLGAGAVAAQAASHPRDCPRFG